MTYPATAFILRRQDIREWDRLYTVLTREHGKLLVIGKGTRRPKAKLAAHCEPFTEADLMLARGRQMDRIIFARARRTNEVFSTSPRQLALASFVCECLDALTKPAHPDSVLYDLLRDTLEAAGDMLSPPSAELCTPFLLRLFAILGYTPELDRCVECRRAVPEGPAIGVPQRGGVVCGKCSPPSLRSGEGGKGGERWSGRGLLTSTDRTILRLCSAAFIPQPVPHAISAFASQQLLTHLPYALRSPWPSCLTAETANAKVAAS